MFNGLLDTSTIPLLEQVTNFAQSRHAVLAGNIANLDTPGYKVRDLSPEAFEQRLREALTARHEQGQSLSVGLSGADLADPLAQAGEHLEDILYHDESTGSLEKQVAAINKNQLQHNLAVAILTSQFRLLQAAVSERA